MPEGVYRYLEDGGALRWKFSETPPPHTVICFDFISKSELIRDFLLLAESSEETIYYVTIAMKTVSSSEVWYRIRRASSAVEMLPRDAPVGTVMKTIFDKLGVLRDPRD